MLNQENENMIYMFHAESTEILENMEESLLFLQNNEVDFEKINSIFRAFHTIKGGAAIFNFEKLVDFTHKFETLLDKIREKKLNIDDSIISMLLNVKDNIGEMLDQIIQNNCQEVYDNDLILKIKILKDELNNILTSKNTKKIEPKLSVKQPTTVMTKHTTLKVEASKIDKLINILGEMVITTASITEYSQRIKDKQLKESIDLLSKLLEELREISMKTRMVPIGETFNKYKRVVRDLSIKLSKDVQLEIVGAETELDKTIIEKISDPIMHIIRNSLDHGIESKEERLSKNKPEIATIKLSSFHEAGNIVIKIEDDGAGLNKEKILQKAIEKDLISSDEKLMESDIFALIFKAGFSTVDKVSDISGRGVGMDVVKQNIEELRGFIEIDSEKDKGTSITIKLPLTLAIIDGFMVKISEQPYIIPLDMIHECIELTQEDKDDIEKDKFINLRDHILAVLDLRKFFKYEFEKSYRENIVIVSFGSLKVGLIVDEVLGEFQTVIKPMNAVFKNLKGIGGATILGNGKVAPILDIPVLLKYANKYGEL